MPCCGRGFVSAATSFRVESRSRRCTTWPTITAFSPTRCGRTSVSNPPELTGTRRRIGLARGRRATSGSPTTSSVQSLLRRARGGTDFVHVATRWRGSSRPIDRIRWRKESGGLRVDPAKRPKEFEKEKVRLKELVADPALDHAILKGGWRSVRERRGSGLASSNWRSDTAVPVIGGSNEVLPLTSQSAFQMPSATSDVPHRCPC